MSIEQLAPQIPVWTLGDRLRKAREVAGLDQSEMAEILGLVRNTVGNYENGHTRPGKLVMREWSMKTGVPLEWLWGDPTDPGAVTCWLREAA